MISTSKQSQCRSGMV